MVASSLVGVGIYSTANAARLLRVEPDAVRRWLNGYRTGSGSAKRTVQRLWKGDIEALDSHYALSFLDLMEAQYVVAFRAQGVSWLELRRAHERAAIEEKTQHPFATRRYMTDGQAIVRHLPDFGKGEGLDEVRTKQRLLEMMRPVVSGIDFEDDTARRWHPLGNERGVVLDPKRRFGEPITKDGGVPTWVLAAAVAGGSTRGEVASWYDIGVSAVDDAVEFEKSLAA